MWLSSWFICPISMPIWSPLSFCRYGTFNVIGLAPSLTIQHPASKRYHDKWEKEVSSVWACDRVDLLLEQFICHFQSDRWLGKCKHDTWLHVASAMEGPAAHCSVPFPRGDGSLFCVGWGYS